MITLQGITEKMDNKKLKLIYDISSAPEGLNFENVWNIMNNTGIVVWDSTFGGKAPEVISESDLHLMDVHFLSIKEITDKFSNIS